MQGVVVGAVPEWLNDNLLLFSVVVIGAVTILVLRTVQKTATRLSMLMLLAAVLGFVLYESEDLERCGRTCSCELLGQDVELPACDPDILDAP